MPTSLFSSEREEEEEEEQKDVYVYFRIGEPRMIGLVTKIQWET